MFDKTAPVGLITRFSDPPCQNTNIVINLVPVEKALFLESDPNLWEELQLLNTCIKYYVKTQLLTLRDPKINELIKRMHEVQRFYSGEWDYTQLRLSLNSSFIFFTL